MKLEHQKPRQRLKGAAISMKAPASGSSLRLREKPNGGNKYDEMKIK
jgi:hypothetical protein